ncbi:MAG TPA: DUF1573 domain-containing protein [Planctomycetes bacterium]|nr:DUF1573 domain-containing protein [Planctomycetota bacterium]
MTTLPHAPAWLRRRWPDQTSLALLALMALVALVTLDGCDSQPQLGLVAQNPVDPARPYFHDFGTLEFGQEVERTFTFKNTDSVPVTVLSLHPACTCTRVRSMSTLSPDGGPAIKGDLQMAENILRVEPGGTLDIVVAVNTTSIRPNSDSLNILRVRTDSKNTPFMTFELHVLAEKLFTLSPAELRLGDVPISHGGSKRLSIITGYPNSPAEVVEILETTGGVEATLQPTLAVSEVRWDLTATLPPLTGLGARHETILLSTTDEAGEGDAGRLLVHVWARVVPDVVIRADPIHFGLVNAAEGGRAQAELKALVPGTRVRILEASFVGAGLEPLHCEFTPLGYVDSEGRCDRWNLELSAPAGMAPGRFQGSVECLLDDEGSPRVSAALQGVVR